MKTDEQEIVERLRRLSPELPDEQRFWDDFSREVRARCDATTGRRRGLLRFLLPVAVAASATAVAALLVLRARPHASPAGAVAPAAALPAPVSHPLPPPDDIEELDDAQLAQVLADLGEDDDAEEATPDPRLTVEVLSDDVLGEVLAGLEGV